MACEVQKNQKLTSDDNCWTVKSEWLSLMQTDICQVGIQMMVTFLQLKKFNFQNYLNRKTFKKPQQTNLHSVHFQCTKVNMKLRTMQKKKLTSYILGIQPVLFIHWNIITITTENQQLNRGDQIIVLITGFKISTRLSIRIK